MRPANCAVEACNATARVVSALKGHYRQRYAAVAVWQASCVSWVVVGSKEVTETGGGGYWSAGDGLLPPLNVGLLLRMRFCEGGECWIGATGGGAVRWRPWREGLRGPCRHVKPCEVGTPDGGA